MDNRDGRDEQTEELPAELLAAIRRAGPPVALISPEIDKAVLREARAQFSARAAGRKSRLAAPAWLALAASLLLAVFIVGNRDHAGTAPGELYSDVNGSGSIDIADVLVLARASGRDRVPQSDLDRFALRLVSLAQRGRQGQQDDPT